MSERWTRSGRGLLTALAVLVLAGCAGFPVAGPVGAGAGAVDEPGTVFPLASSPASGADPRAIVQGFLAAGAAGPGDNFALARQYLAGAARSSWQPTAGVLVYSTAGTLNFTQVTATRVSVALPVVATLDADGRYTEAPPGARQDAVFDLLRNPPGSGASRGWTTACCSRRRSSPPCTGRPRCTS